MILFILYLPLALIAVKFHLPYWIYILLFIMFSIDYCDQYGGKK